MQGLCSKRHEQSNEQFITYRKAALWKTWDIPGWTSGLQPAQGDSSWPSRLGRYSYMIMFCNSFVKERELVKLLRIQEAQWSIIVYYHKVNLALHHKSYHSDLFLKISSIKLSDLQSAQRDSSWPSRLGRYSYMIMFCKELVKLLLKIHKMVCTIIHHCSHICTVLYS